MNTIDKSRVKNAPLELTQDDADFVEWATTIPDGSISAGRQSMQPHLEAGSAMSGNNEEGRTIKQGADDLSRVPGAPVFRDA